MKIQKVGVVSLGKVLGVLYAFFGLIIGGIYSLMAIAGVEIGDAGGGAAVGIAAIILFPIIYGAAGFLSGIFTALFFNLAAKWVGGLEVETA